MELDGKQQIITDEIMKYKDLLDEGIITETTEQYKSIIKTLKEGFTVDGKFFRINILVVIIKLTIKDT